MGTNYNSTNAKTEPTVIGKSLDLARKIIRFCLAVFLWSHAFFLLNIQSKIVEYVKGRIHVTTAEAILFVLLLTFHLCIGVWFWADVHQSCLYLLLPVCSSLLRRLLADTCSAHPEAKNGAFCRYSSGYARGAGIPRFSCSYCADLRAQGRSREQSGSRS